MLFQVGPDPLRSLNPQTFNSQLESLLPSDSLPVRLPSGQGKRHRDHRARDQRGHLVAAARRQREIAKAEAWSEISTSSPPPVPKTAVAKVIELCTTFIPQHFAKWFNPVTDVQVLAPMHKGVAGVGQPRHPTSSRAQRFDFRFDAGGHQKGVKTVSG